MLIGSLKICWSTATKPTSASSAAVFPEVNGSAFHWPAQFHNPPILILDEATSQIDIESEQLIHKALEHFTRDRTAVIITHRLSTLDLADRILVLEAGRVVDLGPHNELIARCELYRRLYQINLRESA